MDEKETRSTDKRRIEIALIAFICRVASSTVATEGELQALPRVVDCLIEIWKASPSNWFE